MAALLHQAALPTAKPHPWALTSTSRPAPLHVSTRRRAPTILSSATDSSVSTTDEAATSKKMTRKEKQHERRRQQDMQQRQEQLIMEASLPKAAAAARGGGAGGKEGGEDDDELPQPVFDRILRRIMVAVGVPMTSGVALLNLYEKLKSEQGVDVPSWLSLLTILVSFGTSALGIAYGTLSASWDPEKEGSLLGIDEARTNWPVLWQEEIEEKAKQKKKE
ncbi:hypothetical protein ACP4OV_004081 [Aristida adscensionis]